jgi:hypothetical protein
MLNIALLQLAYVLLFLFPAAALIFDFIRERKRDAAHSVAPFDDLQRRPAGESTRLKLENLDEDIETWLGWILIVPIALALALALQPRRDFILIAGFFLLSAVVTAIAARKLRPLRKKRRAYHLGFQGERYVAEELNLLLADGFQVFHDVPFDKFNIDHILVGPRGIFVVETKTRRKPLQDGKRQSNVRFDGKSLLFPHFQGTEAVDQTIRNKNSLNQWLSSATGDRLRAHGILTIPGWFVETSTLSAEIQVLNPKQIRAAILNKPIQLDASTIQRAKHQLEQKCKLPII